MKAAASVQVFLLLVGPSDFRVGGHFAVKRQYFFAADKDGNALMTAAASVRLGPLQPVACGFSISFWWIPWVTIVVLAGPEWHLVPNPRGAKMH